MRKQILLFSIFFFFSLTFISAFGFGEIEDGGEFGFPSEDYVIEGANYSININDTEHLEGRDTATLYTYFKGLFDDVYCQLTGCTMTGNITSSEWFNGKFNWTTTDDWSSFDGNTFDFNESKLSTIYYNATSAQTVEGTIDGTISLTQHPDGDYDGTTLNITEVSGSPGLDVRINFTDGLTSFSQGVMRYYTSSLAGDYPIIQMWDYNNSQWNDFPAVGESLSFATIEQPVFASDKYVQDGVVQMRLYKSSNGNTNNEYYIDWITIAKGYNVPTGEEIDPLSIHRDGNVQLTGDWNVGGYNITNVNYFDMTPATSCETVGTNCFTVQVNGSTQTCVCFDSNLTGSNITADYFIGDGSLLTNIEAGNSSWNQSYADTIYLLNSGDTAIGNYTFNSDEFKINGNIIVDDILKIKVGDSVDRSYFIGQDSGESLTTGLENIGIGRKAMEDVTEGDYNIGIGNGALLDLTIGNGNTAIGWGSAQSVTTGGGNVGLGVYALNANTDGGNNMAIGRYSLGLTDGGNYNIGVGNYAGYGVTTGLNNVGIGYYTLGSTTTGNYNTAVGDTAMRYGAGTGSFNTAIGYQAGRNSAGNNIQKNTFIGTYAGRLVADGSDDNVVIGYFSGYNLQGDNNVFLGKEAGYYETGSNKLFIDNQKRSNEADARSKALIYGVFDATPSNQKLTFNSNIGIGTTDMSLGKLQVNGSIGGISIYAENNISAEDYLYHSPFTTSTKEESLNDILKIKGDNGKIDHSSLPEDTKTILNKPIYETETYEFTEEVCDYEKSLLSDDYKYVCENVTKTATRNKQTCINKIQYDYIQIEDTDKYERVSKEVEVCTENEPIDYEEETQTSIGILLSKIILSIQELFDKDTVLENRIKLMEETLCSDGHLEYCIK